MKKDTDVTQGVTKQEPSRRKLLKALTASGAAAAVMPSQWTSPAIKAVILPAHAQTTPGALDCGIQGWFWVSPGSTDCFSMSANIKADNACTGPGRVRVFDSGGSLVATCSSAAHGGTTVSFSCSTGGSVPLASEGDRVTFVAELSGGCTCTFTRTVE